MARKKYTARHHRKAFELYMALRSFHAVSQEKGMPTSTTLFRWSAPDYPCQYGCPYHGWEELERQKEAEVAKRLAEQERNGNVTEVVPEGLESYIYGDIEDLKFNKAASSLIRRLLHETLTAAQKDKKGPLDLPSTLKECVATEIIIRADNRLILGSPTERKSLDLNLGATQIDIDKILEAVEPDERKSILRVIRRFLSNKSDA